jgi:outer membrane immunogenic protein
MRKLTVSILAFTALTGAAFAADLPAQKAPLLPAPELVPIWTGVYAGVQAGGAFGNTNLSVPNPAFNERWGNNGVIGGAHIGYNHQINTVVLGVESSFDLLSVQGSEANNTAFAPNFLNASSYHNYLVSIDGRLGYAYKNLLFYGIGGYAFLSNNSALTLNGIQIGAVSNTVNGYDVGGGVEYAINDRWSARAECRYYNFQNNTNNFATSNKIFNNRVFTESVNSNVFRVGLSYKWGVPEPVVVAAKY